MNKQWTEKVVNRTVTWKQEPGDRITYVVTGERVNHIEHIVKPECRHVVLRQGERHLHPTDDDSLKAIANMWDAKITLTDGLTVYDNLPASSNPWLVNRTHADGEYPYFEP